MLTKRTLGAIFKGFRAKSYSIQYKPWDSSATIWFDGISESNVGSFWWFLWQL